MLIIADDRIPGVPAYFSRFGEVVPLPAHLIRSRDLKDAQALIVRSVTNVDLDLLRGTSVTFVGTATAGLDHIDATALRENGITVAHAAGSNAPAVCDYVLAALFDQVAKGGLDVFNATIGIVGVGNVGDRLRARLDLLGIRTLLNDPPRVESEISLQTQPAFVDLSQLLTRADIITLHVPLTHTGRHATFGLLGKRELTSMKDGAWLINTSRGGVLDEQPLIETIESDHLHAVIDVWAGEPVPNCKLVRMADVATPHIAGYGIESKLRATEAIGTALAEWAGTPVETPAMTAPSHLPVALPGPDASDAAFCSSITRQAYDITRDHLRMQGMCSFASDKRAEFFRELRDGYRLRSEFSSHAVTGARLTDHQKQLASGLGFEIE